MRVPRACGVPAGALVLATVMAMAVPAEAQTRPPKTAVNVGVSAVYDDNIFSQPVLTSDTILRITPAFMLFGRKPRVTYSGELIFDAERYQDHPSLTTAAARQEAGSAGTVLMSERTSWTWGFGFVNTTNPTELVSTTILNVGRRRANFLSFRGSYSHMLSPRVLLEAAGDFSRSRLEHEVPALTSEGWFRAGYQYKRSEIFTRIKGQHFNFGTGITPQSTVASLTGGWARTDPGFHLSAEAGAQVLGGTTQATADLSIGRLIDRTDITVAYGRAVTSAVGYIGPISYEHIRLAVLFGVPERSRQGSWQFGLRAGFARNHFPNGDLPAYDIGATVTKPIWRRLVLQATYDTSFQNGVVEAGLVQSAEIMRNRASVSLVVSPWVAR